MGLQTDAQGKKSGAHRFCALPVAYQMLKVTVKIRWLVQVLKYQVHLGSSGTTRFRAWFSNLSPG